MTTLSDIRDRIRIDLHDEDAERWDGDALNRHIGRALSDIDNAIPREASALLATTPGSRDIDISSLAGLIRVEQVEYPAGRFPPEYSGFSQWDDVITLQTEAIPLVDDARVFYTAAHELDDVGTTLPAHLEDVLATGAAAYAILEQVPATLDALNTGGPAVPAGFEALGRGLDDGVSGAPSLSRPQQPCPCAKGLYTSVSIGNAGQTDAIDRSTTLAR